MKNTIKYLIVLLLIVQFSCDPSRIETEPLGKTENDFFSTNAEFREALVSVYAKFYDYYFHRPYGGNSDQPHTLWYLPGDDLTETHGTRTAEELFDGTLNSSNSRTSWVFDKTYEMIAYANVLLEKVTSVNYSDFDDPAEIAAMEGEALFLRSYAYYLLFNMYGNVPLVIERIKGEGATNTPVSDKLKVLDQVIIDSEKAIAKLPESWPQSYAGRATKNSARGLLAKALIFRGNYTKNNEDYSKGLAVFNSITASLVPTYTDNFSSFAENNSESLFEIQASTPTAIDNIHLYNDGPWRGVETLSVNRGLSQKNGTSAANGANTKLIITEKLLNGFGDDPRIAVFLESGDGFNKRLFQKYTLSWLDKLTTPFQSSANNERVLRYADLKLIAAEAALKTGNTSVAINHVNDVRKRARDWGKSAGLSDGTIPADYPTSETNKNTIIQWIMNERFVELAGEGQRWWDLKRWHVCGDLNLNGWNGGIQNFSTNLGSPVQFDVNKHLLFPLPQSEIDRNSAIDSNNPGY